MPTAASLCPGAMSAFGCVATGAGGCDLVSGEQLGSWAGSVVFSTPHSSQLGGGSPRPLPGHAAQCTLRVVCWGAEACSQRAEGLSCFTRIDRGPGKDPNAERPPPPCG